MEKKGESEPNFLQYMHMSESEKENNTTFDKIHANEEYIRKIPLCHCKHIESIDQYRDSPCKAILSIRKSEKFIGNGEHPTGIDEGIDDQCIERIITEIPDTETQKCEEDKSLFKPSDTK